MTPPQDDSNKNVPSDDELSVKIALAVGRPDAPGDCPSDLELAALIDGRVDDHQQAALWEHLDACDDCYQTWLLATEDIDPEHSFPRATHPKSRLYIFSGMAAAAMLAFLMLYLNWPALLGTDPGARVASAYDEFMDGRPTSEAQKFAETVPLPWQHSDQTYGFNQGSGNEPANLAFGAGLFAGRKRLVDSDTEDILPAFLSSAPYADGASNAWHKTAYNDFFQLGKWCLLLVAACQSPSDTLPNGFWEQQNQIAADFKEAFQSKSHDDANYRIAVSGIGLIEKNLIEMNATLKKKRTCMGISAQAVEVIQFLGPTAKPE